MTTSSQPLAPVFDPAGHDGHVHAAPTEWDPRYAYAYSYAPAAEPSRAARFLLRIGSRMPAWSGPAGVALCLAGGIVYTLALNPTVAGADSQPTCVMKLFTGFDCPGCGGTRAMWFMLHGNLAAAARNNLPFVFAAPFVVYMFLAWTLQTVTKKKILPQLRIPNLALIGFMGAWLAFSILRNLPWAPFTWFYV